MARCDACGSTILFGGSRHGDLRYCNDKCLQRGLLIANSQLIPQEVVQRRVWEVHQGNCPKCQGRGPVDVHNSYKVWSMVLLTTWQTEPQLSCRACGVKSQAGNLLFSLVLGWWGFPWGLIMTPVQVTRNLLGMFRSPDPLKPSPSLEKIVRMSLAS